MQLSPEQRHMALNLRSAGKCGRPRGWTSIAKEMGLRERDLLRELDPEMFERKRLNDKVRSMRHAANVPIEPRLHVPKEVLFERERAYSRPWTREMVLFGDPLPGRSALARRRAA